MTASQVFRALILGAALLMAGCAAPTAILTGFQDMPSAVNFVVTDARHESDKTQEIGSLLITSCAYGIYRYGDNRSDPPRMVLLRHDLEASLGDRVRNSELIVTKYRLYFNARAPLRNTVNGTYTGVVPAVIANAGEGCTKEQTGEGWFDASDTTSAAALIVEIGAKIKSKDYTVRTVSGIAPMEQTSDSERVFGALRKANAALADMIGKDLHSP